MNVDILFSIVGHKPPRLPLREERQTDGIEIVYNAKGIGHSAVCKEQEKREALLLEKLERLEKKLERKASYRRTKKREKALMMVKDLKYQMENSASGISYEQYLDELRKMRREAKEEKRRNRDLQLNTDPESIHNASRDDSSCMSEASCSTAHIESKVMKALQTLFDDPELADITDDEYMMDEHTADETASDLNTTSDTLLSIDALTVKVANNENEDDEVVMTFNESTALQEDSERDELEEDHKRWERTQPQDQKKWDQTLPETISLSENTSRSNKTTHTSITKRTSNRDETSIKKETLETIQSARSSPSSVRFKDVKPTVDEQVAQAKAILNNAKDLRNSFSLDSSSSVHSKNTDQTEPSKESSNEPEPKRKKVLPLPHRYSADAPIVNEKERYHLFLSHACPYSHRVIIIHALKRLQNIVSFSYVRCKWDPLPLWGDNTVSVNNETSFWSISKENHNDNDDAFESFKMHHYNQEISGSIRVPVLWDKKEHKVVSNRCTDMMKILNFEFNKWSKRSKLNLFPAGFKAENEDINKWIHNDLFIPIYKCGLSRSQREYNEAIQEVTNALDQVEVIVKKRGFLAGQKLTESDIRLFVLLLRFDEIYRLLFKTNTRMVEKMTGLMEFMRDIYNVKGIAETCDMEKIKSEFYGARGKAFIVPRGRFIELLAKSPSI